MNLFDAFHRLRKVKAVAGHAALTACSAPIQPAGAVHKVTAMDSDEDGRIVVRLHYDYAEEE